MFLMHPYTSLIRPSHKVQQEAAARGAAIAELGEALRAEADDDSAANTEYVEGVSAAVDALTLKVDANIEADAEAAAHDAAEAAAARARHDDLRGEVEAAGARLDDLQRDAAEVGTTIIKHHPIR